MELPKNYNPKEAEARWSEKWTEKKIYSFDKKSDKKVFSIDTPPPTISGKLHIGHAFSYSQQDFIARFRRMNGENVFYPFGVDNNGIATERLVEKLNKVKAARMDRTEFIKLCMTTLKPLVTQYISDMKTLGLSCDFDYVYETISDYSRRISQQSFLDLYEKGRQYRKDAPTMWCPNCQTAVSQVEAEDIEMKSHFNDIIFKVNMGDGKGNDKYEDLIIATTRPEYIPACVAIFYHPDDKKYEKYKGKKAKVPLFDFEVPILSDDRVDPEKGTGILMCCTFGDQMDMEWYMAYDLPNKVLITKDGKMTSIAGKYEGLSIHDARKNIILDLKDAGLLVSQKDISHPVKVHERCSCELEIISTKQWFIKYLDIKDKMLEWGDELKWYPAHMKVRYDNWVKGLQWDWCISRQRYSGISIPCWYCEDCDEIIVAKKESLPVDPLKDSPPVDVCPKCGSKKIIPDKDVLDTWATSSLSPQIATGLVRYDKDVEPVGNGSGISGNKSLYPMTLRPQAHDIITFWLFNTVVKSRLHNDVNPWKEVVISGHAQDPHGKKMSKSKGNVVDPFAMIDKYCADALRFWAAGSKLGDDMPFQEKDLVTGKKMITKLWNASKFSIMHLEDYKKQKPKELLAIDRWALSKMNALIKTCTESFERYEYSKTKSEVEKFFWNTVCDNYLEIAKSRLYNPDVYGTDARVSAQYTLYQLILTSLKMMAPIMPFITEEIYNLYFAKHEGIESIHNTSWPKYDGTMVSEEWDFIGDVAIDVIASLRRYKSDNKLSLKSEIGSLIIKVAGDDSKRIVSALNSSVEDIKRTMNVKSVEFGDDVDIACNKYPIELGVK